MKIKSALWMTCYLTTALGMIAAMPSLVVMNQSVSATLLESDQNNLGGLLLPNETDNGQTVQKGNDQPGQQQQPEQQLSGSDTGVDEIPKSQSEPIMQDLKDTALVNRIFPLILKKLDSAALLKIVDGQQLLQKLDGKQLLEKVLPYIHIVIFKRTGAPRTVEVGALDSDKFVTVQANCDAYSDEVAISGSYKIHGNDFRLLDYGKGLGSNSWNFAGFFGDDGTIEPYVECMKLEVAK